MPCNKILHRIEDEGMHDREAVVDFFYSSAAPRKKGVRNEKKGWTDILGYATWFCKSLCLEGLERAG